MADQGLWFKLWCSCLDDPDLSNLEIADFGRWAKLGAFMKRHGVNGEVVLRSPSKLVCAMFQVDDFDALELGFMRLPNVCVRRETGTVSSETLLIVSFRNWRKYQGDFSTQRVKAFRARKRTRGEEKRGEEKRREEKDPPPVLQTGESPSSLNGSGAGHEWPADLTEIRDWLVTHDAPSVLHDPAYWHRIDAWLGSPTSGVAYLDELAKFLAWLAAQPRPQQPKQLKRAFRNWLAKSEYWSQSRAQTEARRSKFPRR